MVFAVAARAYRLHVRTISVPAVSAAALRGAQLAPLVFAVSGLVTAFAFTISGPGRGRLPSGPGGERFRSPRAVPLSDS
jgi:hypothetical protein